MNALRIKYTLSLSEKLILILLPMVGVFLSVIFSVPYIVSIFLFYVAPAIYLALQFGHWWQEKKAVIFAIVFSMPFAIIVDYIGIKSGIWYTPHSIFATRFLTTIPLEDFLWMIAGTYTIITIYETLLDKSKHELVDRRVLYFVFSAIFALGVFFFLLVSGNQQILVFNSKYTYLILATIFFLLPALFFLIKFPKFFRKLLPLLGYFFYLTFLFEVTATYLGQWVFNGQYIVPPLNIFGTAPIAWEELFFVGIVGPITAIAFYELFDNGRKNIS